MLEFNIQDVRLKSIVDPFENGNYKKALQEINKVLKKTPNLMSAKALKALTLVKMSKITEAIPLAEEVVDACPTDESTVSVVMCYFRETGQSQRVSQYLKNALEKCGNREDLLVCLFLSQAQEANFSAQQQTARQLSQLHSSRVYTYWVIVSTLMQAESDPLLGQRMFLPLAEKMLSRDADECKMETHIELQLLIEILERLNKPSQALDLLTKTELLDRLNEMDYHVDYTLDRLRLVASLDDWDKVIQLSTQRLEKHPNEWNCWKFLIDTAVKSGQWETCKSRVIQLVAVISNAIERSPSVRGPQLAGLDLLGNALQRGWHDYPKTDAVNLLQNYITNFATKPICALDLAYLIPLLLPNAEIRKQFIENIVRQSEEETVKPGDAKQIYRRLCSYQIARANYHPVSMAQLLGAYFAHASERLLAPVVNSTEDDIPDRTASLDLCPADGFLSLATSNLAECPNPLIQTTHTLRTFAQTLLTAYWIDQLGLVHAPSNHHFRLRLCSLYSLHGLACPELALPQSERMEMKQLLFVSLGHMLISPGPLLTCWANPPSSGQQHGDTTSPLLTFFQRLHVLSGTSVSEAVGCLVAAYRQRMYTKICEFTRFADRLKHADVFLLVRMELAHWQLAVIPDDFDALLEQLGAAAFELDLVSTRLEKIVDCRDFSVSQNFDPPMANKITKQDSFAHMVAWIRLRMLAVRAICQSTQLLMSTVKLSEWLLTDSDRQASGEKPQSDKKALDSLQQLEKNSAMLVDLVQQVKDPSMSTFKTMNDFLASLVLPTERLITTPTQLPQIPSASLYLYGPYKTVLHSGVQLMVGIHRLLVDGNEAFSEAEQTEALNGLGNPFSTIPQLCQTGGQPDWTVLPRPPIDSNTAYLSPSSDAHSPTSILILLGMLYETFALDCLFISMARSVLRPRSHFLQQANKRQRRKAAKARKSKGNNDGVCTNPMGDANQHAPIAENDTFKRLDQIGHALVSVVENLSQTGSRLLDAVGAWLQWSRCRASSELMELSASLCAELFPELIDQYPIMKPTTVTALFTQIAASYEQSFSRLANGLRPKCINLGRISDELQVYECGEKLASCHLQETNA